MFKELRRGLMDSAVFFKEIKTIFNCLFELTFYYEAYFWGISEELKALKERYLSIKTLPMKKMLPNFTYFIKNYSGC